MLPPAAFDPISETLTTRFTALVNDDTDCTTLPDLLTAEEAVLCFVVEAGRRCLQSFVDVRSAQAEAARPACSCGKPPPIHRSSGWWRKTLLGPIRVRDPYMYCRRCSTSTRPLHAWLGTEPETWSLAAEEAVVDLATDESCGNAVAKLARHHPGVEMGRTTALRLLHKHGASARRFIDNKLSDARRALEHTMVQDSCRLA